jgi:hypothetical protein
MRACVRLRECAHSQYRSRIFVSLVRAGVPRFIGGFDEVLRPSTSVRSRLCGVIAYHGKFIDGLRQNNYINFEANFPKNHSPAID